MGKIPKIFGQKPPDNNKVPLPVTNSEISKSIMCLQIWKNSLKGDSYTCPETRFSFMC